MLNEWPVPSPTIHHPVSEEGVVGYGVVFVWPPASQFIIEGKRIFTLTYGRLITWVIEQLLRQSLLWTKTRDVQAKDRLSYIRCNLAVVVVVVVVVMVVVMVGMVVVVLMAMVVMVVVMMAMVEWMILFSSRDNYRPWALISSHTDLL